MVNTYEQLQDQQYFEELFGPRGFDVIYHHGWVSWEEHGEIFIIYDGTQYMVQCHGSSVMSSDNSPYWAPDSLTEDEAIELMIEWDAICEEVSCSM